MMTSYWGNVKNLAAGCEPVAISQGVPTWHKGRRELRLAPSWAMLKMSPADYDRHFDALLARLDPAALYQSLGSNAVLLCWEPPGFRCHRRRVAEWLEAAVGVSITEFGFTRDVVSPYSKMPRQPKRGQAARKEPGPSLFGLC